MDRSDWLWLLKLFLLTGTIAIGIKTLGIRFALPEYPGLVLALTLLPSLAVGMTMAWLARTASTPSEPK